MKCKINSLDQPYSQPWTFQSGYWQLPVNTTDQEKTAFCSGPGMGLYEFRRMPFGLTGAPSLFQHLMDKIFRGLSFVTTYVDDILVHSADVEEHSHHLQEVFQRLADTGLTLRGKKCHIGMKEVSYLGHVFSSSGMAPDPKKIQVMQEGPGPTDVTQVRQFLGLASYYRRYIHHFSDIAAPLNSLTKRVHPSCGTKSVRMLSLHSNDTSPMHQSLPTPSSIIRLVNSHCKQMPALLA